MYKRCYISNLRMNACVYITKVGYISLDQFVVKLGRCSSCLRTFFSEEIIQILNFTIKNSVFLLLFSPRKNINVNFFSTTPLNPPLHENILIATARSQSLELINLNSSRNNLNLTLPEKNVNLSPRHKFSIPPHSKNFNSLEYVNRYSIPPIIFFPLSYYSMFWPSIFKKNI